MIIRLVTYHALDGKDVERWMQTSASELRCVKGMRHLEFIRSKTNSSQYGAIMHFRTMKFRTIIKARSPEPTRHLFAAFVKHGWIIRSL